LRGVPLKLPASLRSRNLTYAQIPGEGGINPSLRRFAPET